MGKAPFGCFRSSADSETGNNRSSLSKKGMQFAPAWQAFPGTSPGRCQSAGGSRITNVDDTRGLPPIGDAASHESGPKRVSGASWLQSLDRKCWNESHLAVR